MDGRTSITMNSEIGPDKFKANQRKSWDNSVANGWEKWWKNFEG